MHCCTSFTYNRLATCLWHQLKEGWTSQMHNLNTQISSTSQPLSSHSTMQDRQMDRNLKYFGGNYKIQKPILPRVME